MSQNFHQIIATSAKLAGGSNFWNNKKELFKVSPIAKHAPRLSAKNDSSGNSQIITVGNQPIGFGSGFLWDRKYDEALLVVFINAADSLGISIDGLQENDSIEIISATGISSFSEDDGNPLASSIVGLIATGAKVGLDLAGYPEAVPLVNAAEKFAQDQFKATHAKTKRRDPFGEDPGTGHKAREEGGVIVCMPSAKGAFYSGNDDNKNRWILNHEDRTTKNLPPHIHVGEAFFLNRHENNKSICSKAGQAYLLAWDWKFEDNAGFYKLFVKLSKGVPVILT